MNKVDINKRLAVLAGLENIEIHDSLVMASVAREKGKSNVVNIQGPIDYFNNWSLLIPLAIKFKILNVDSENQLKELLITKLLEDT